MITNKVTKLYSPSGVSEDDIQAHFDAQNELGYYLISANYIGGWYRFFWALES